MHARPPILESRAVVPDHVVLRDFEAETLLLNLETGAYHGVDGTGARTLELLRETGGDVQATVDRLAEEHGLRSEDVAADLATFLEQLAERGLVAVQPK
jgi:Coenzyme PQQ synthesis protein D (PqqD)